MDGSFRGLLNGRGLHARRDSQHLAHWALATNARGDFFAPALSSHQQERLSAALCQLRERGLSPGQNKLTVVSGAPLELRAVVVRAGPPAYVAVRGLVVPG
jgi:hypothetical protein